jgi:hypothetical protein
MRSDAHWSHYHPWALRPLSLLFSPSSSHLFTFATLRASSFPTTTTHRLRWQSLPHSSLFRNPILTTPTRISGRASIQSVILLKSLNKHHIQSLDASLVIPLNWDIIILRETTTYSRLVVHIYHKAERRTKRETTPGRIYLYTNAPLCQL